MGIPNTLHCFLYFTKGGRGINAVVGLFSNDIYFISSKPCLGSQGLYHEQVRREKLSAVPEKSLEKRSALLLEHP